MPPAKLDNDAPGSRPAKASWWPVVGVGLLALLATRRGPAAATAAQPDEKRPPSAGQNRSAGPQAAAEPGRGRDATAPHHIPAKGWKDIVMRLYADLNDHRILAVAAGVTFYALLALFPAVAAFVSLYGLFADAHTINDQIAALGGILPGGALEIIGDQVKRITSKPASTLGFALVTSLAISLWSANAGMKAMFDALNIVYDEKEKRGFVALNLWSLGFTLGAIAILMIAIASVVVVPVVLQYVGLATLGAQLLTLARWPLMLAAVGVGLAVLYRYGPSRRKAQWRWVFGGSGVAAVFWLGGSALFSWYVSSFGNYNETYGSLGAAIGFMTWIWISSIIVLMGAELDAETEHQTAEDTTTGPPKPLGTRGANMADTIGAKS